MRTMLFRIFALLIIVSMVVSPVAAQNNTEREEAATFTPALPSEGTDGVALQLASTALEVSETGLYIIQLVDPAVPSYKGGIPSLEATSPQVTGQRRLDASSPAVQAYVSYLHSKQDEFIASMNTTLGRSTEVVFRYDGAMNGLATAMSHEEALQVNQLPGVKAVFADTEQEIETDVGPWFLGAPSIWDGDTGSGVATRGEGVVVGIIDTGVNFQHPSFAATDGDGYTHTNPYGAGVYNGWCATNPGFCNAKLIGAYGLNPLGGNPADDHGHGSHTGSTAAGNFHDAVFDIGNDTFTLTVAGVAPRANVVAYKVCTPGCPQSASIQAVNHAIMDDQVDVLNYSISGVDNPWNDGVDLAFLEGFNAGIYIAASAGNSGPGPSTVAKTGPWNASTAASTINRIIAHTVDVVNPTTPPELQDMAAVPGENVSITADITEEIRFNADNPQGCNPGHPAGFFDDAIALIIRGACTFEEKVNNATAAGAEAVVVFNHVGGPPISMGGLTSAMIPSVMIDNVNGADLRDYVLANPGAEVTINAGSSIIYNDDWENVVAGFSSRGPSQFEMLAPTFIAPGVNTLAAGAFGPSDYYFSQGTSMSSPHAAGAGALLMALNPTWSPAEVRSALAMTANPDGFVKEDGVTPADWFDVGSGLLDLTAAGNIGLVMDETYANFVDANPAIGGDPKTLNLPAFLNYNCTGECSWTRTVTSVAEDSVTYNAVATGPAGMVFTVIPSIFTIAPGETQELMVTVNVDALSVGDFAFADIKLVPQGVPPTELLNESFTDTIFPPAGWSVHWLEGEGTRDWRRDTGQFNSGPASAQRQYSFASDGDQDSWLVTPPLSLDSSSLTYYDRGAFMSWYGYSGVWISTGSCDPTNDDFVELLETDDMTATWRQVSIDLSEYDGETACIAFRYSGGDAHDWWIDDVVVADQGEPSDVATVHMPVAVIPALAVPVIDVDPDELNAAQPADEITTQTLTISNNGGVDLEWEIAEEPAAVRLGLTIEDGNTVTEAITSEPYALILDDGVGENAVGLTGGAQFLWFNRFTPSPFNFPVTLDRVEVMFGYPGSTGGINVGELVDIYLYEDADGNPANGADHVASLTDQAVQAVDGITWSVFDLPAPVTFNGPGDILIAVVNRTAGVTPSTFPAVLDQTPPSQQRSWIGFGAVPGDPPVMPMPTFGIIDGFGIAGNWMVRGFGTANVPCTNPADVPWLDADPDSGTTGPGGSSNVTVSFDSTGLAVGEYNAFLCITSNDPAAPLVEVPVMLEVIDTASIDVSPASLDFSVPAGEQDEDILTISNLGMSDLFWYLEEENLPSTLDLDLLYSQMGNTTTSGVLAIYDLDEPGPWSVQAADDFVVPFGETWYLQQIYAAGFYGGLINLPSEVNVFIYADDDGKPGAEILALPELAPTHDAGALVMNLPDPLILEAGHYWVSVQPKMDYFLDGRWFWFMESVQTFEPFHWRNPGGGYGTGCTDWSPGSTCGFTFPDLTFALYGTLEAECMAFSDIPWLVAAPDEGVVLPGESDEVTVTVDATGLTPLETYYANLCVFSNDPVNPVVVVPVSLEVIEPELTWLQVVHLAPFAEDAGVTITLNGAPALTDFAYGDSTEYIELPAGTYDVAVIPTGAVDPAIEATVTLEGNTYYTVIAVGDGDNQDLDLILLEDDLSEPAEGMFHLRLGHLAPFAAGAATADIRLQDGTPVLLNVDFGDVTGFIPLEAGEYDLKITTPGGAVTLIDPLPVDFAEGMIISAFASGDGVNQDLGVFALPAGVEGFFLPLAEQPTAAFSFSPSVPLIGQTVTFVNETTGTEPISYLWDFGDGATSTEENPTHIYTEAGLYTVTLTATNDFGMDVYTAEITVGDLPVVPELTLDLSVVPDPVILNQPATFTAVVTNISTVTVEGVMASGTIPDFVIIVEYSDECSVVGDVLTCDLGDLGPGETASAWVTVIFTATGTFDFSMEVEGMGAEPVSVTLPVTVISDTNRLFMPLLMRSQ
jgi:PKD repeat protein